MPTRRSKVNPTPLQSPDHIERTLRRAAELHRAGETPAAEALYAEVLRAEPRNAGVLHVLGLLAHQSRDFERARGLIAASVDIDPSNAAAHSNLGNSLMALGRHREAVAHLDRALERRTDYPVALLNRGICRLHLDDPEGALGDLSRALEMLPGRPEVLVNRAVALRRLGRAREAFADCNAALAGGPEDAATLMARGAALIGLDRPADAAACLERAVRLAPANASAHADLGLALTQLARLDEGLASVDRALDLDPGLADALSTRGWLLIRLGRHHEAAASVERALELRPRFAEAWTVLGVARKSANRLDEARACFERALEIDSRSTDARGNLGAVLMEMGRFAAALEVFRPLLLANPPPDYALGQLFEAELRTVDWSGYAAHGGAIVEAVTRRRQAVRPFFFLAVCDDPARQLECARMYAERHYGTLVPEPFMPRVAAAAASSPPPTDRIRVAYVSGEFSEHAVSYLIAGLLERHDRARFEITAISLRAPQDSDMGRRIRAAVDRFVDVSAVGDAEVVAQMRALEIDIAVDLSGYTGAGRTGIFARRAAPLQINYLAFPGTMGISCMDYIVADRFVIPPQSRAHYFEHVVYLPGSFQANDDRRVIGAAAPSRAECGLPERGFVFCSFNNTYKINPAFFAVWLDLLREMPDSVLWLLGEDDAARRNLRGRAAAAGIDPARLVFAQRLPYAHHLGRLTRADLFLDSLPFNGGTTASDALWAGVPLVTQAGASLAARMGGSLLGAVGLPELITNDGTAYAALALRLARDPALLASLRARLAVNRSAAPLFDTRRFCRGLESAYATMVERHRRGEPPADFAVEGP
ncbi:MAG TPA: tetratricopeptide repeat protein [Steroidobacteraceae bacterium]|jgi:predicted O-linked N-acetylglucosamine transferase (SPINDLY family)|nr:tetratricopeptide repeat protein [Steroidobacteraceae bacterium]